MKRVENIKKIEGRKSIELNDIVGYLEKNEKGELTDEECRKELGVNKATWNRLCEWYQRLFHN